MDHINEQSSRTGQEIGDHLNYYRRSQATDSKCAVLLLSSSDSDNGGAYYDDDGDCCEINVNLMDTQDYIQSD